MRKIYSIEKQNLSYFTELKDRVTSQYELTKEVAKYKIAPIALDSHLEFANEYIPLDILDVKERVDREFLVNTYWQSNAVLLIKRAKKYFPIIEPILADYGVPNDFKYLAVIESGLTHITSPAGAKGFWQIMKKTAKEYGLEVNDNVDERYHIEKSTEVACKYLIKAKEKLGSWTNAAAAYNMGISGVSRRLEKQQVNSYYDLLLNNETARYVFRIIAVKYILNNPEKYGFVIDPSEYYHLPRFRTVKLDTAVTDFNAFVKKYNINYKELKLHNTWLREDHLNNASRKKYEIKIPVSN